MRRCGTPGCRFHDHHQGPHSHECARKRVRKVVGHKVRAAAIVKKRRAPATPRDSPGDDKANDFQLGIDAVRIAMDRQRGVRIRVPLSAFAGHWPGFPDLCHGVIVKPLHQGKFVAEALFDGDADPTPITSSMLMLHETCASWRKPRVDAKQLLTAKCAAHVKHTNAYQRAVAMCETLLELPEELESISLPERKIILTLDGMGTNRIAIEDVMNARGVPATARPDIVTLEMDADVAAAQRIALGFGDDVRFTKGDPLASHKSLFGGGIEHVVTSRNSLLSEDAKRDVVWLNLDYCGGPPKNHRVSSCAAFMQKMLAHLPGLNMVTVTMAKRNHADLDNTFDNYFPPPYGFELRDTFRSNPRVVCKMYVRAAGVVRRVAIPGSWWLNADPAWKKTTFDGIVMGKSTNMFSVYVPHDDRIYPMRADAVSKFASDFF